MIPPRHISYFSLTAGGALLALRLRDRFGGVARLPRCQSLGCGHCDPFDSIREALPRSFAAGETAVCVMAAGIVFRVLAPHLRSKQEDPAVIVIDEDGRHVVPLLGGHAAGANEMARDIAAFLGAEAAITTASDVQGRVAPDEVARRLGAVIDSHIQLRKVTSLLVDGRPVCIEAAQDPEIPGYDWIAPGADVDNFAARLLLTYEAGGDGSAGPEDDNAAAALKGSKGPAGIPTARLVCRSVAAGIGCRRGTSREKIIEAVGAVCEQYGIDRRAVGLLASVDLKRDEAGLAAAAEQLEAGLVFYAPPELQAMGRPGSAFVEGKTGTAAVCEPAALLAAGREGKLLAAKTKAGPVTVALAASVNGRLQREKAGGCIFVVGTGAGTADLMTGEARRAIDKAGVVLGYRTYIRQLSRIFPGKEYVSGPMGGELERCRRAVELALEGRAVALVSSGDAGVYGMAGPLLELAAGEDQVHISVVPGVTAAQFAAARLGAPLMNDYIALSLSDLLTPRREVIRRARLAAASDMVVCLYNPASRNRQALFAEVCEIFLEARPPGTPVGWVRDGGGPEEVVHTAVLGDLCGAEVDMRTIIIIGNSQTELRYGKMITRRGYKPDPGRQVLDAG